MGCPSQEILLYLEFISLKKVLLFYWFINSHSFTFKISYNSFPPFSVRYKPSTSKRETTVIDRLPLFCAVKSVWFSGCLVEHDRSE